MVVRNYVIVRRTDIHRETHFNDLENGLSKRSLRQQLLSLITAINILDVALNVLKSYTGFVPEKCSGFTIE